MSVLNFTARTWAAAEKVTAALLNAQLRDPLNQIQSAWTSYTPTLTAATTNPTLGSGSSATGNYHRLGKTVFGAGKIVFGTSGVAAGSGNYFFGLPVSPNGTDDAIIGAGYIYDVSATSLRLVVLRLVSGKAQMEYEATGASSPYDVDNALPWTWAASDQISVNFFYEAA